MPPAVFIKEPGRLLRPQWHRRFLPDRGRRLLRLDLIDRTLLDGVSKLDATMLKPSDGIDISDGGNGHCDGLIDGIE